MSHLNIMDYSKLFLHYFLLESGKVNNLQENLLFHIVPEEILALLVVLVAHILVVEQLVDHISILFLLIFRLFISRS